MLDVEGGVNPLVKDIVLDSTGFIFALLTYEKEDDEKVCWQCVVPVMGEIHIINTQVIRVQKYDQVYNKTFNN